MALRLQAPRLDRIVRGRAWIPVLGVLLIAIVGLRVEVLKLGSSVGSQIQQATSLQSANAALRARISALSDNQRIATLAGAYGMHMPNPLDVHFVQTSVGSHVPAAIRNISVPSNSTFLTGLAAEQRANEQSNQAVAAMNGAATNTGANTAANGNVSAGTTSPDTATTSTATGSVSNTTPPTTGVQGTTGVTSSTGVSDTSSAGTTPPASTAGGSSSDGGTARVSSGSGAGTSQTSLSTGSTDGGSGLAG